MMRATAFYSMSTGVMLLSCRKSKTSDAPDDTPTSGVIEIVVDKCFAPIIEVGFQVYLFYNQRSRATNHPKIGDAPDNTAHPPGKCQRSIVNVQRIK